MKKTLGVIFSLLVAIQTQAQDYLISFAGTGGSTTVDSVQVRNLTQNTWLTLNGADVLHLMGVVGIDQAIEQTGSDLRIYPNPMNEQGFVEFETTAYDVVTIELCDITGKQATLFQAGMPCGNHTFAVSGLRSGIYTVKIKSAAHVYLGKIVCISNTPGNGKISYIPAKFKTPAQSKPKSIQSQVQMQYNTGDQLLFRCFAEPYITVVPLVPTQSQAVIARFVACTDADNNNYATVTIGTQTWMAENVNVGNRIDGVLEQTNNGTIEKYCFNNDENMCSTYGGLYQWNEMMQYETTPGARGICPTGWHLPTDAEWCTLTQYSDTTVDCGILGWSGITAGGKNKSTGTIQAGTGLWYSPNGGATNENGFSAIPAGARNLQGEFNYMGYIGYWWNSSSYSSTRSWYRFFNQVSGGVYRLTLEQGIGLSVRCVKDF